MKRPMLVSGTAVWLSSAILISAGIKSLFFLLLGTVSVFVLYCIKPLNLRSKIIIPTICLSVVISCISFGLYHFTKIVPATKLDNTVTNISGKIISTPEETAYGNKFILKTDIIGNDKQRTKIQVFITSDNDANFKLYDYVSLPNAKLTIVRNEYNKPDAESMGDGVILETSVENLNVLWESERTPFYYCLRLKEIITCQINTYMTEYHAGFLSGMLFGDKSHIDDDITTDFRATGIAHLLAVSGLHTSTWCAYIIALLTLFRLKEKLRNTFCIIFLCGLCIVSGFTPSVVRASIVMAVLLIAPFFKEEADPLNSLGFAVVLLILNNPYIITSPSFLLSVFATLGVLASLLLFKTIRPKLKRIKNRGLLKFTEYFLSTLFSTVFAGLFTLPVSAYFFGAFSTVSPLTNLICVKPAFWSLITGVVATAISFLPQKIPQLVSIYIFKISILFSDFVTKTANALEKLTLCTLPIHKEYFILGLAVVTIISLMGFLLFKINRNKLFLKISSIISAVALCLCVVLPCTTLLPPSLTVINVENGVNISLRQGLEYAYINCGAEKYAEYYNCLPMAKCETLDFLYVGKTDYTTNAVTEYLTSYSPETTVVTKYSKEILNKSNMSLPQDTVISNSYIHRFNDEITLQTVDTYPLSCVIIKGTKKTVAICYGENSDINLLFEKYGAPDVLVLSENVPQRLPENVETLIISSDSEIILNKNLSTLKSQCKKYYSTAENGNIKILL
ncbi:MAG: ComEC/Rec2 family competence protein [Acutalibacteraceae bacterium]